MDLDAKSVRGFTLRSRIIRKGGEETREWEWGG